jgi:hypothetical protein
VTELTFGGTLVDVKVFMAVSFKECKNSVLKDKVTSNSFDPEWNQTGPRERTKDGIVLFAADPFVVGLQIVLQSADLKISTL